MVRGDDDLLDTGTEVHGPAHTGHEFPGDGPVGDIPFLVDLQRPQDSRVNMTAADESEGRFVVVDTAAGNDRSRLAASIDDVDIDMIPVRRRAAANGADFSFQPEGYAFGQIVDAHQGQADS